MKLAQQLDLITTALAILPLNETCICSFIKYALTECTLYSSVEIQSPWTQGITNSRQHSTKKYHCSVVRTKLLKSKKEHLIQIQIVAAREDELGNR